MGSTASSTSVPTKLHQRTPLVIGSRARTSASWPTPSAGSRPPRRISGAVVPARAVTKPVYGPGDWAGDPERDLGAPGEFPFTRGVYPTMYTGRLWTMRQYAGFGTAQETNRRFRQLLAAGQTGLSTAFDLPTQMGYDSDHPMAHGEVGRVGVAIDTVDDLAELFREIPLDRVSTSMTINATAAILLAMYIVVGEEQGVPRDEAHRHGAERRPQGVHRPRHVHLSGGAVAPAGGGHLPLRERRGPELQPDLDQRLPHARGGRHRGAGSRVHAGERARVRAGGGRRRASRSTRSVPGSRSSSPATTTCSRRRPSSAPRAGSGRGSCASASAPTTRRLGFGSTRRPAASLCRPSSRSTTWCG